MTKEFATSKEKDTQAQSIELKYHQIRGKLFQSAMKGLFSFGICLRVL